jgi:formylglycine-generating enzyme required for sulfatase activity
MNIQYTSRTIRGGSWYGSDALHVRAADRDRVAFRYRDNGVGFRCADRDNGVGFRCAV